MIVLCSSCCLVYSLKLSNIHRNGKIYFTGSINLSILWQYKCFPLCLVKAKMASLYFNYLIPLCLVKAKMPSLYFNYLKNALLLYIFIYLFIYQGSIFESKRDTMWPLTFLFWLSIMSASTLFFRRRTASRNQLPRGPPAWWIFGNMFQLGSMPHCSMTNLRKKYGDVIWLKLGSIKTVENIYWIYWVSIFILISSIYISTMIL